MTLRLPAAAAQVGDELGRIAARSVGRGVDVDVLVLARDGDHLLGPRVADVPAHDGQLGEVDRDLVDVGDRAAGLRRRSGPVWPTWVQNGTPSSTQAA